MSALRMILRDLTLQFLPPYRRVSEALGEAERCIQRIEQKLQQETAENHVLSDKLVQLNDEATANGKMIAGLVGEQTNLLAKNAVLQQQVSGCHERIAQSEARVAELLSPPEPLRINITRGTRQWSIAPDVFEAFSFRDGDTLQVTPFELAKLMPSTWGDINIFIESGCAIRVPALYGLFSFKGFDIPAHLISLTGAGPETFDTLGRRHIELYDKFCGLAPEMTVLEIGCGIGRDALQLIDRLSDDGNYIGIDVTRDSIVWCQENITRRHPNFTFYHFDAENELYNPHGQKTSMDFKLPVASSSVDRIFLASVFTHLLEAEVLHYLTEFARVLKPDGQVYASFFLHTPEALAAAKTKGNTSWDARFDIPLSDGVYANDPDYPRGAVAFTDDKMQHLIAAAGLRLVRPYLKGWWSGLHAEADDGQDVAILTRAREITVGEFHGTQIVTSG